MKIDQKETNQKKLFETVIVQGEHDCSESKTESLVKDLPYLVLFVAAKYISIEYFELSIHKIHFVCTYSNFISQEGIPMSLN